MVDSIRFEVSRVGSWGQRTEPPPQTLIGFLSGYWLEASTGGKKYEKLGIYLGDGYVLTATAKE